MAVEIERGFSIREHVAKIRSIDIAKCRPFDGEPLPPMDVRKFRWWPDEVSAAAESAPPLAKQKTPKKKKRSIVELFAISPQITAVGGETETETSGSGEEMEGSVDVRGGEERVEEVSDGEGLYYADLAAVSKREEKDGKLQLKNCRGEKSKKIKNKVERRKLQIEICVASKEKTRKPKITSSLSISQLLQEVKRKKMLRKPLKLSFQAKSKKKKRKKFPSSLSGKEHHLKLSHKGTPKSKTKTFTVQSILKKQVKTSPIPKHVSFSGNDDIFEREIFSSPPVELLSVRNAGCLVTEEQESLIDRYVGAEEPGITTVSGELGIEKEKENSQGKCVDLNKMLESLDACIEIHEDSAKERPELMAEITGEPSNSCLIDKEQVSHADQSGILPGMNIVNRDLISVSSSTGSNKSTSTDTRLNTDCLSNLCVPEEFVGLPLNSQGELTINPKPNLIHNSSELFMRNEMLPNPSSGILFPGSVPVPVPASLPFRPIAISSTDQKDVRMRPLYFKDMLGTEHYYAPLMPVRPGSGFMHLPGFERMEILNYDPRLDHIIAPMNIYQTGKNNAEPTVRLMGKNVSVGRSSKDCMGLTDRTVWADKGNNSLKRDGFPFSRERKQGLSFSVEPRFNTLQGQVYSPASANFSNGYSTQPVPHLSPVFTHPNDFRYQKSSVSPQVLLNSTHYKHNQSRSISFASSSHQGEVPQWIQNPRSKTHKPSFPSYVNPTTTGKQPHIISGNRPNLSPLYPGTVISFPAFNSGNSFSHSHPCISIPPLNSTFTPYLTTGHNFTTKDKGKVQNKTKFHLLRPSDYINQNNKRPLERDDMLARQQQKRPFQSDLGLIAKPTGPDGAVGSEEILDFSMKVGKATNEQVANTKSSELGNGGFIGPSSGFSVRSGPVKLSAGVRHVLTPGPSMDRVNPRPIHSTIPLIGQASLSQKSTEEIFRF